MNYYCIAQRWYGWHADYTPIVVATLWNRCGVIA